MLTTHRTVRHAPSENNWFTKVVKGAPVMIRVENFE
jgi:hypothetical protein